jgi:hypothetical protein
MTSDRMVEMVIPLEVAVHVAPLSVERKTPLSVATNRVEVAVGLIARAYEE